MLTGRLGLCISRAHTSPTIPSSSNPSPPSQSRKVRVLPHDTASLHRMHVTCLSAPAYTIVPGACLYLHWCKTWGLQACMLATRP